MTAEFQLHDKMCLDGTRAATYAGPPVRFLAILLFALHRHLARTSRLYCSLLI